jgi:hypothetical protein
VCRYDVDVDVDAVELPVGKDGKVDADALSGTLRGQVKIKQDREGGCARGAVWGVEGGGYGGTGKG